MGVEVVELEAEAVALLMVVVVVIDVWLKYAVTLYPGQDCGLLPPVFMITFPGPASIVTAHVL